MMLYRYSDGTYKWSGYAPEDDYGYYTKAEGDEIARQRLKETGQSDEHINMFLDSNFEGFLPSRILEVFRG